MKKYILPAIEIIDAEMQQQILAGSDLEILIGDPFDEDYTGEIEARDFFLNADI